MMLQVVRDDVFRDAQRLRADGQSGVHRRGRREERRVDYEEVLDVVGAAEGIEHGMPRVGSEDHRAALVRGVSRSMRVRHDEPEAELPKDPFRFLHELVVRAKVVRTV